MVSGTDGVDDHPHPRDEGTAYGTRTTSNRPRCAACLRSCGATRDLGRHSAPLVREGSHSSSPITGTQWSLAHPTR